MNPAISCVRESEIIFEVLRMLSKVFRIRTYPASEEARSARMNTGRISVFQKVVFQAEVEESEQRHKEEKGEDDGKTIVEPLAFQGEVKHLFPEIHFGYLLVRSKKTKGMIPDSSA